jgi:hypothetical protein
MTADPLDQILDRSAPARPIPDPADVRTMVLAARAETPAPRRARRTALLSGALALFLVGGAGVAVASSDWLWGAGLDDPDRVYSYTSPTWGECELRFSALDTHDLTTNGPVNRIVDEWFATTDVEAAAAPLVPGFLAELEDGRASDATAEEDPRQADLDAWTAHEQAVSELVHAELADNGFGGDALAGTDSHSQVHCDGEDWGEGE